MPIKGKETYQYGKKRHYPVCETASNSASNALLHAAILSKSQAAEFLRLQRAVYRKQVKAGRLRACRPTGNLTRIFRKDIDAFLESGSSIACELRGEQLMSTAKLQPLPKGYRRTYSQVFDPEGGVCLSKWHTTQSCADAYARQEQNKVARFAALNASGNGETGVAIAKEAGTTSRVTEATSRKGERSRGGAQVPGVRRGTVV